ncbi:hypothetical protein ARALYDRAFT_321134 [Arabidopsis lyrata subsp. lyrata]|uniref:Uncharacterized protein n=1 Tax=Arabidopsis lyrata subsp. lyrata TaxID=81972 RepID=D7LGH0_ARALL|nr:hypothetical protein ARALYDRAFT_321134 [Arabidopsis lyrata subsp. lyrata]
MGGVEDNQWFDKFMDEIGLVFTKVDESIQKSIELWTELTKDIFDEQPNQGLTGQPDNGESGEENSSQYPVAEVKERPIQHWSMCLSEVKEKPSQHWTMRVSSKIPESFIQEQGDDDDAIDDNDYDDDDDDDDDDDYDEEDSESSLKWNGDYQLLKSGYLSFEEEEEDNDDDADVDMFSEEDDDSWNEDFDDEDEEEDTTVSKSSENMLDLNLGASATSYIPTTSYIPSSYHRHNEKDSGSSLPWNGGYQQLKNVDTSSEEDEESWDEEDDEVGEYHTEEVMEMSREQRMSKLNNESLVVHDDEDDVSDTLQGFVDVRQEVIANNTEFGEVEALLPEGDWVYVRRG